MTNIVQILCLASWYHCAQPNGCASWSYPIGTMLRVTERHNGSSVVVKVVERGPAKWLVREGVLLDLSEQAFKQLDGIELGHAEVTVTKLNTTRKKEKI